MRKYYHALVVYKIQRRGLIFSFDQAVNHAQEVKERKLLLSNESSSSITEQVVSLVSSVGNSLLGWMYSSSEKTSTELDASTLSEECENWSSNRLEYLEKFLVVTHELNLEEIETDEMIESSLITCIAMAEATNQNLYSSVGLDEFEILKARAISFQKSIGVPLRIFEVACPDMFFEIADSNEVVVETSIEMDFSMDSCLQGNPPSVKF